MRECGTRTRGVLQSQAKVAFTEKWFFNGEKHDQHTHSHTHRDLNPYSLYTHTHIHHSIDRRKWKIVEKQKKTTCRSELLASETKASQRTIFPFVLRARVCFVLYGIICIKYKYLGM